MRRVLAVLVLGAAGACAAGDERPPAGPEAERRALETVREAFSTRLLGDGSAREDAAVARATPALVEWTPGGETSPRVLRWGDVEALDSQRHEELPSRPETVYLYLARGSRSVESARPERPPLSGSEVVRCYVVLRDRPYGTRARLERALELLGRERAREELPAAPGEVAPSTSAARVEARLRQLKDWHARGLIDDEVYREEQRKALAGP